jgi:hypothetical protein
MKQRIIVVCALAVLAFSACGRAITPAEAASGKYKHCRSVR